MNCLTYLLDLWRKGERFEIRYSGDHCLGVNEYMIYDLGNCEYESSSPFLPLEKCHTKEIISKIFELNELNAKTLEEYYEVKNN